MSDLNAANPAQGITTLAGPSTPKPSATSSTNDKDLFLKLMVEQMSNQDPMNPTSSDQWLAQMAQFNTVEQLTSISSNNDQQQAVGLLGKTVTYNDDNGGTSSGTVDKVTLSKGGPTMTIAGQDGVLLTSITDVQ